MDKLLRNMQEFHPEHYQDWLAALRETAYELRHFDDSKFSFFDADMTRHVLIYAHHVEARYCLKLAEHHDGYWDRTYSDWYPTLAACVFEATRQGYPLGELALP